jgi:EmrB/QacA subfamily drug resistance transporter
LKKQGKNKTTEIMTRDLTSTADARARMVIIGAACAAFMNVLDSTIVNVSLPSMVRDFKADTSQGVYVLLAYSIMMTGTVLMFGKLADRRGMRLVMIWGFLLFTASSLLCGLAPTLPVLVAGRFLQGIGGGMLSATSLGAIGYYLPPDRRGWGVGIISAASALGATLGAPLGGLLSELLVWRWIFLVNIPVGLAAWWLAAFRFPRDHEGRDGASENSLDVTGVLLSVSALSALLYAITRGPEDGWLSPSVLGGFIFSMALFIAFLISERRCRDPLLDMNLFKNRRFLAANMANFFTSMLVAGILFLMPFFFVFVRDLSPSATGAVLMLFSGVYVLVSPVAGRLSDRMGVRFLTTGGMALASVVLFLFTVLLDTLTLAIPIAMLMLMGAAYGAYLSPNNRQILSLAPEDRQGSASGILRLFFYLGQPLGVALVESVLRAGMPAANISVSSWSLLNQADLTAAFQVGFAVCGALAVLSACCSFLSGVERKE